MVSNVMWMLSLDTAIKRAGTTAEKGVRGGVSALGGQSVSWRVVTEKISAMGKFLNGNFAYELCWMRGNVNKCRILCLIYIEVVKVT